jgi:cupin superfamily acireductone dioxygenase involved in methionine salvage
MKTYTFIEEHDFLLNEIYYFTRLDGIFVPGSMSKDYALAYSIYQDLIRLTPKNEEKVLFTMTTPSI